MAVITKENVNTLVESYFEVKHIPMVQEKCKLMYTKNKEQLPMRDIYNIFWAIQVLADRTGKYTPDDIEFHVKKNPIFAEISTDEDDDQEVDKKQQKPKQVGLLRQAIHDYERNSAKITTGKLHMTSLVGIGAKL
jgi:hypothetical protein